MRLIRAAFAIAVISSCIAGDLSAVPPETVETTVLKSHGIEPTAESIRKFLRSFLPGSDVDRRQKELIPHLGAASFARREAATRELVRLSVGSIKTVQQAAGHSDPEIRWRVRRILAKSESRSESILLAVFRTIHKRRLAGLGKEILDAIPHCKGRALTKCAADALRSSVSNADAELLRRHSHTGSRPVRIVAIATLERLRGTLADAEFLRLTDDDDERIQVAAARALANHGRRDALRVLVRLLGSNELQTRLVAAKTLRAFTGRSFAFTAYEPSMVRAAALGRWRKWTAGDGATAALKFPLKDEPVRLGRTLFCDYSKNRLVELDAAGKIVWETKVGNHPWGTQGLPNGHRLVANYSTRSVNEYDERGKLVWSHTGLPGGPTSVRRLQNGNTLMACTDSQMVVEVNRGGKAVLSLRVDGRPTDAQRLENGRTLVVLQNGKRVVEVDRKGAILWKITGLAGPFSARRLENGNTLVSCISDGTVREFNRKGEQVWSKNGFQYPNDVQRLPNGNTLVSDRKGLTEVDKGGKIVKRHLFSNVSKFYRY